ncbi:MAG: S41 family peptidase [Phycisphaerae bacterium]|nr:S41 family peptidase [Phycisphaerae bacterium]
MPTIRASRLVLPAAALFLAGVFVARLPVLIAHAAGGEDWTGAVGEVRRLIESRYVEPQESRELLRGAIDGMTRVLNDPYSEFIAPSDAAEFEKEITGRFVGIGATITIEDGWLTIASPIEDSPALAAGLRAGDRVVEIDGASTKGLSTADAVRKLTGREGTSVSIGLDRRPSPGEPFVRSTVTITRRPVAARAAHGFLFDDARQRWNWLIDPAAGIAYVRLAQFTDTAAAELQQALAEAASAASRDRPLAGIILDLRDNPGGILDQAVAIADLFLESGEIVSTRGRSRKGERFTAARGGLLDPVIAVLVNSASASASEVVAGALQDNQRAIVLGTRTFGKGLVQAVEPLESVPNGYLKLTEQRYYLPSGRMIHRTDDAATWGVDPSPGFYVPLSDAQQRDALRALRAMQVVRPPGAPLPPGMPRQVDARWFDPAWIETALKDRQLALALKAVQGRLSSGAWQPTGEPLPSGQDQATAIATRELRRLDAARERLLRDLSAVETRMSTLESAAGAAAARAISKPDDLWPDAMDLTGGRIEIFSSEGSRVALLDITGPDLERWLLDADVRPRGWRPPEPEPHPATGTPATGTPKP